MKIKNDEFIIREDIEGYHILQVLLEIIYSQQILLKKQIKCVMR